MNGTWVKLYRKSLNNEIFKFDRTAWHVFEVLLIIADHETGTWSGGLFQLSDYTNIKKDALYKSLKRLETAKMINRGVNARYTVYRICKWGEYQSEFDNSVNAQYTLGKRSVNSQYNSNKNKDIRNKNNIVEIQNIYDLYIKEFEKNPNQYRLTQKRKQKINSRLKDAGKEMLERAIKNIASQPFYRGDNDRGWQADLDFITKSYEQVEKFGNDSNKTLDEMEILI